MLQKIRQYLQFQTGGSLAAVGLFYLLILQSILVLAAKTQLAGEGGSGSPFAILCTTPQANPEGDSNAPATHSAHGLDCCVLCRVADIDTPVLMAATPFVWTERPFTLAHPFADRRMAALLPARASFPVQPRAPPQSGDIKARA